MPGDDRGVQIRTLYCVNQAGESWHSIRIWGSQLWLALFSTVAITAMHALRRDVGSFSEFRSELSPTRNLHPFWGNIRVAGDPPATYEDVRNDLRKCLSMSGLAIYLQS